MEVEFERRSTPICFPSMQEIENCGKELEKIHLQELPKVTGQVGHFCCFVVTITLSVVGFGRNIFHLGKHLVFLIPPLAWP